MRPRDLRAILFWIVSTMLVLVVVQGALHNVLVTGLAAAAYNAWLLSRPRTMRVFRRLRGERLERSGGYFRD